MDRLPFRRFSEASSDSPFMSPDGHVGTDHELDTLPARLQGMQAYDPPRYDVKSRTSRSGASSRSPNTNQSESSSPSRHMAQTGKGKAKMWTPPPPISASIYGSMNPLASILRPSKSVSPSRAESIASSTYRHVSFGPSNHTVADDPFLVLSHREQELQAELQELLDAQSDGLQAGLGGGRPSASASVTSDGSNTPTASKSSKMPPQFRDDKYSSMVVRPVRQPNKKKPSLRAARRGILRSINELASLKEEENNLITAEILSKQTVLRTIDSWEQKISEFRKAIEETAESGEARELQNLQSENRAVETEIHELENRLMEMHAKKRTLGYRISELQNRQEAGVSSYKEGLRLAERNVEKFLSDSSRGGAGRGTTFWALPRKRRTLGLARDHYTEELESSKALKNQIGVEGKALVEGAEVWAETINSIMSWETGLRKGLTAPQDEQENALRQVLNDLNVLIQSLALKEDKATENGWKLLIVAIGAEIAYLKEGREVLQNILGVVDDNPKNSNDVLSPGTLTREDTSGFDESFRTAEGESSSVLNLKAQGHHHGLSELETDIPATPKSPFNPQNGESGTSTPSGLTSSQFNGLRNSINRKHSGNDRMTGSGSGSNHFKNGSLSLPRNPDTISTPPLESPNGDREATPLGMSPLFDGSSRIPSDKMTGSGRLTMSWRDKGKGKLGQRQDSSTESEDEGPDPELLVGNLGDDVE